jgi:superfamily I DNA and/or RNA helicase
VVQNPENTKLMSDIFEYTNISKAVSNKCGHEWLVLLDTQYRMHYEIADFVSLYMYEGLLKTGEKIFQKCRAIASISPKEDEPIVLVDISDMYSVCLSKIDGDSRINIMSALICIRIAEQYIDKYEVGIITPYRAQARLIFAMIRDLRERDSRYNNIVCATVHQFQGSEKPVIIYDAVDCYRAKYVGYLLTSKKNDTANRLFNVALTRAKGKFILVANRDYFIRKHISKELMFTQCLKQISNNDSRLSGNNLIEYLFPHSENQLQVYVDNREESFEMYLNDLSKAKTEILIDMPSEINDDEGEMEMLIDCLSEKEDIKLSIRRSENLTLPKFLRSYSKVYPYVTTPISIIDKEIIWFGHPMFDDDFISEGSTIKTKYFPCFRFEGKYSARTLKNFLEL